MKFHRKIPFCSLPPGFRCLFPSAAVMFHRESLLFQETLMRGGFYHILLSHKLVTERKNEEKRKMNCVHDTTGANVEMESFSASKQKTFSKGETKRSERTDA